MGDKSDMVGEYRNGVFSLIDSLSELLGAQWKVIQDGKKVPGFNLWSWMWINPAMGPGKIHLICSSPKGTHRSTVMATINGEELSGQYHTDENFYLELITIISRQLLYQMDYRLKNDVEELDTEE